MAGPVRNHPAPVDEAALDLSLRPFGSSVMLPPAAYTDPAVFGWEQEHLLGGGWTCVGFSAQLPEPGAEQSRRLGAGRVRLARDGGDGAVRAFTRGARANRAG
jgi:Rieske 2Fe-2S family protein